MNRTVLAWVGTAVGSAGLLGGVAMAQKGSAGASQNAAWVHVRVEETDRASRVSVNLPMPVVEAALSAAPDTIVKDGRIKVGGHRHGMSLAEMRRIWREMRNAGDAELASIEEKDETVEVSRRGDIVHVRVTERSGKEEVEVDVPAAVVDAALGGEEDSIDFKALVQELRKHRGDVVRVTGDDGSVRVWIDENAGGK
jgi:hypothetical protein